MSLALTSLGSLGARIIVAHLLVIALGLAILRAKMRESQKWEESQKAEAKSAPVSILFKAPYLGSILGLVGIYGFCNLWVGTNGFFFPYSLQFGGGFGAQSFFQLWSAEQFPTALRATAQGVCFAIVRIGLGIFSFFVPLLTATGFTTLAWILTGFLMVSGLIGWVWAPRNEGKSLAQLEAEQVGA
jgi:hypothetical protein